MSLSSRSPASPISCKTATPSESISAYELKLASLGKVRKQIALLNIDDDGSLKNDPHSFSRGKGWAKKDPAHTVIPVVYSEDRPVAWGILHHTADCGSSSGAIASTYVDPLHRGHGLGVQVASVLWQQAEDQGLTCIQVDDSRPDAKALWSKTARLSSGHYKKNHNGWAYDMAGHCHGLCSYTGDCSCLVLP
jgi:GNAT superfamily N-acetyltransferase